MNRDQLRTLLGDAATDEVVDAIMADHGRGVNAEAEKAKALRAQLEEANARISEFEEAKRASMTSEEQWQARLDKANKAAAKAARELNEMCAVAELKGAGLSEEEYAPFLGSIVGDDRDATVAAARAICSVVSARADAAGKAAKKAQLAGMGAPAGGTPGGSVASKKDFEALSPEQQMRWVKDNPGQLSQLK